MSIIILLGIALGLAMDAFAVSIAISAALKDVSLAQLLRLALYFGLFQSAMLIIGWLAGQSVADYIAGYDHWVAFGLLAFIGGRMIYSGLKGVDKIDTSKDPTRGATVVILAVATSIDALAVGLSFIALGVSIWYPAAVIGAVAFGMTALGMKIGGGLGEKFGDKMEIAGGLVLIAIGAKIVIEHIMA